MRIIIDGYNAIAQIQSLRRHFPHDLKRARDEFNDLLRRFKKARGHKIAVVYDGPGGMWGRGESSVSGGIREIFTSEEEQADDVIIRVARKDPRSLIVVTADRRVADVSRKAGATVISPAELDEALLQAALMECKDVKAGKELDDRKNIEKKGPSKRLSKKKRREIRTKNKL